MAYLQERMPAQACWNSRDAHTSQVAGMKDLMFVVLDFGSALAPSLIPMPSSLHFEKQVLMIPVLYWKHIISIFYTSTHSSTLP